MATTNYKRLRTDFNKALRRVRGHVAAAKMFMDAGDLTRAYGEAEQAQHAAFDAKDIINDAAFKQPLDGFDYRLTKNTNE